MWKNITLLSCLILCAISFAQNVDLISLEEKKKLIEQKIRILQDSLSKYNVEIRELKSMQYQVISKSKGEIYVCKGLTKLMDLPKSTSNVIDHFKKDTRLIVVGFYGDYMKVEVGNGSGYVHRIYLEKAASNTNSLNQSPIRTSLPTPSNYSNTPRKSFSSRTYYRGPKGGCYYINSNGNKSYVDRSLCN
tara:strand:- start:4084 stop:4653 length:570 start_codon:yes stop_codon:yes gene_type:complete